MTEQERLRERWRTMALVLAEMLEGPRLIGTADSNINPMPFLKVEAMLIRHAHEIRKELDTLLP